MEAQQHTQGIISVDGHNLLAGIVKDENGKWRQLFTCTTYHSEEFEEAKANAARIVEAWNGWDRLQNLNQNLQDDVDNLQEENLRLQEANRELLEALKELLIDHVQVTKVDMGEDSWMNTTTHNAKLLIEKHTPKQEPKKL